jgi:hypothetical protein
MVTSSCRERMPKTCGGSAAGAQRSPGGRPGAACGVLVGEGPPAAPGSSKGHWGQLQGGGGGGGGGGGMSAASSASAGGGRRPAPRRLTSRRPGAPARRAHLAHEAVPDGYGGEVRRRLALQVQAVGLRVVRALLLVRRLAGGCVRPPTGRGRWLLEGRRRLLAAACSGQPPYTGQGPAEAGGGRGLRTQRGVACRLVAAAGEGEGEGQARRLRQAGRLRQRR